MACCPYIPATLSLYRTDVVMCFLFLHSVPLHTSIRNMWPAGLIPVYVIACALGSFECKCVTNIPKKLFTNCPKIFCFCVFSLHCKKKSKEFFSRHFSVCVSELPKFPLLGNGSVNTFTLQKIQTQQQKCLVLYADRVLSK
jgi:hypothetical protein